MGKLNIHNLQIGQPNGMIQQETIKFTAGSANLHMRWWLWCHKVVVVLLYILVRANANMLAPDLIIIHKDAGGKVMMKDSHQSNGQIGIGR